MFQRQDVQSPWHRKRAVESLDSIQGPGNRKSGGKWVMEDNRALVMGMKVDCRGHAEPLV